METKYVRMNNNQKNLSLGNFCRIVKEQSLNKTFAGQPEVFYAIFGVDNVSDSTINNYCIGYRSIGSEFKQLYVNRKKYPNSEFDETILRIVSIIKGEIYPEKSHEEISKLAEEYLTKLSVELYNIAKNDKSINPNFTTYIHTLIEKKQIYNCLCELLIYIVLEKKQPIYIENSQRELFENMLNNTNISITDLEQFLKIQLKDGINYTYSLKKLAKEENPYAAFEMGNLEYTGIMTGSPRYVKAYEYFKISANKNHPRANWLIARMLLEGQIGSKTEEDLNNAYEYLKKAEGLGSIAATNTIGLCYLKGLIPKIKKDEKKAIEYFKKATKEEYVYAHNNLGQIYEEEKKYEKAYEHYLISASLEESWASNKLGEWYRSGIYVKKDEKKAFNYYKQAIEVPINILNFWAYFNLAKHYYLEGNYEANIEKDEKKAIEYFEKALENGIEESYIELINIYIKLYRETLEEEYLKKTNYYLEKFRTSSLYSIYEEKLLKELNKLKHAKIILTKENI